MPETTCRVSVLKALGATPSEITELLRYNENHFDQDALGADASFPLPDEPFVSTWERYARAAESSGAWDVLRDALVQLRFPVEPGMSESPAYRAAVRRLVPVTGSSPSLRLERPDGLRIEIHPTPAGRLPIVIVPRRADFVRIMQAVTKCNEPVPIPDAVGACLVAGYANVDRLRRLKDRWSARRPRATEADWRLELREIIPRKALYQDRFMIVSTQPYSGVAPGRIGLDAAAWRRLSLAIRVEHESVHYFTRRVFGSMKNRLLDELIADYAGIVHATGRFRADWSLRFLGLESFPTYRRGGRLEYYRGDPPLSDRAFRLLQQLVKRAVDNLERFDARQVGATRPDARIRTVVALTRLTVEELATRDAGERLRAAVRAVEPRFQREPLPAIR